MRDGEFSTLRHQEDDEDEIKKADTANGTAEQHICEISRQTRKKYSSEEIVWIVISGLRGEHSITELCRREGIAEGLYCVWSKEFMEARRGYRAPGVVGRGQEPAPGDGRAEGAGCRSDDREPSSEKGTFGDEDNHA